jgi:hypothetical protein
MSEREKRREAIARNSHADQRENADGPRARDGKRRAAVMLGTPPGGRRFMLATRTPPDPCGVIHQPGGSSAVFHRGGVVQQSPLDRGNGARGLRSVVEEVFEGERFEVEAGVRYVNTQKTVGGGRGPTRFAATWTETVVRKLPPW